MRVKTCLRKICIMPHETIPKWAQGKIEQFFFSRFGSQTKSNPGQENAFDRHRWCVQYGWKCSPTKVRNVPGRCTKIRNVPGRCTKVKNVPGRCTKVRNHVPGRCTNVRNVPGDLHRIADIFNSVFFFFSVQSDIYYIPRIRRIGGCYGFTSKPPATRRPPPAMVLTW